MSDNLVKFNKKEHIARMTINRPESDNLLNQQLVQEITDICTAINQDEDIYVVVITGAGKVFCCGGEPDAETIDGGAAEDVAGIDRPVIAAVNGDALGEGFELALSCDIRIASNNARFSLAQISAGLIPHNGGTQRLPRLVGKGKALELILTGDTIDAQEAFDIGLVSKVVKPEELEAEAQALAVKVASQAPISLRFTKEAVNKGMDVTLEQGLRLEADLYLLLHTTSDRTEGIKAFLEKRKPEFKGE